jgi:hypothetical protein
MISKLVLAFFFFWMAIDTASASSNLRTNNPCVHKNFYPPAFNAIQAVGDIDIQVDTSRYRHEVIVSGRLKNAQAIKFEVKNSTLWINALAQNRLLGRSKVKVCMPTLARFIYTGGCANITISCIRSIYPLSLDIKGNTRVNVSGNIIPGKIVIGGKTQMSIGWINACDFYLKAMDNAKICVTGSVNTFSADASQCAWINAKYLCTTRAFVKSYGRSRIDVRASCSLSTLAAQNSAIYYYQYPYMQTPFVQGAGSVIPMVPICYPPCSDCNGACCKNGWH